jgi:hypothetical protein
MAASDWQAGPMVQIIFARRFKPAAADRVAWSEPWMVTSGLLGFMIYESGSLKRKRLL